MLAIFSRSNKTSFFNFQGVCPRSSFAYQVFTTVSQDLLSHLNKSKRVKLPTKGVLCKTPLLIGPRCPCKSSYLKYFVIPSFLANKQNLETLKSVILPSVMRGLFLCSVHHKQKAELHHGGCNCPQIALHSINFIKNKLAVGDNSIHSFQLATPSG